MALSAISLGLRIVAYSVNPVIGASLTVISMINASRSDIAKAIPAVICFMQIRCRNFIYSVILLCLIFTVMIFYADVGKNKKSVKKGKQKKKAKKRRQNSRKN